MGSFAAYMIGNLESSLRAREDRIKTLEDALKNWLMAYDSGCCVDRHITPELAEKTKELLK